MQEKKFELIPLSGPEALAAAAAGAWLDEIESANRAGKWQFVAIAGGRILEKFFLATAEKAMARRVSFERVHFFWADERCVPPDDPESNFKPAQDLLFAPLRIPEGNIHRLRGELEPQAAVAMAIADIRRIVPSENGQPVLDLVLLSPGEDGHVASLFQNARPEAEKDAKCNEQFIFVSNSPKPPPRRISLNYNVIAAARQVWVLASGAGKKDALRQSIYAEGRTPLGRVLESRLMTKIFVDIPVGLL